MELIVKKPTFANGVYIIVQLIKKKVYVGESNDIFTRLGEHMKSIAGADNVLWHSNSNLMHEEDKRFVLYALYNNKHYYSKRACHVKTEAPWIYDETIFMFLMRKYGFKLYNNERDNTGKDRGFLVSGTLTSPALNAEKYDIELTELKKKTIDYLFNKMSDQSENKRIKIEEDINLYDASVKKFFSELLDNNDNMGVWKRTKEDLQNLWDSKVSKKGNESKTMNGKDRLSLSYYNIKNTDDAIKSDAIKSADEISEKALTKETMELCDIEILQRDKLAEKIRAKELDTTIFSPFGAYLGQSAATILAAKTEDINNHKLDNSVGKWEIRPSARKDGKDREGFCEWALKRLDEEDTRRFLESTNTDEEKRKHKYIFLTYTPSKNRGKKNKGKETNISESDISDLNPKDGEKFSEFKERLKKNNILIGKKIYINHDKKTTDIITIPDSIYPELIASGQNRAFLISKLYVLDGYVKDLKKMYEYYWAHYASHSDGKGGECCRIVEDHNYYEGKDKYDKVEKIKEGVYRTYKYHQEIKGGQRHKCGRIRGDEEREKFAKLVLSNDFYDISEERQDYRNVIVAELVYPYIGTITE